MRKLSLLLSLISGAMVMTAGEAIAETKTVTVNLVGASGVGQDVGSIQLEDTQYGLLLTPSLSSITPGLHGFHIHENPACGTQPKDGRFVGGLAAGGHFDPEGAGFHSGPYGEGHLGDLPPLYVAQDGSATTPVLAPRLSVALLFQRSIMVHMHGDNFSDTPAKLGGGGARVACGVIE